MKRIQKYAMVAGVLMIFSLLIGCKSDELPCKSTAQGEYELVK